MEKVAGMIALLLGLTSPGLAWGQTQKPLTEPQARSLVMDWGCTNVSRLSMGQNGRWFGECQKGGKPIDVMIDEQGKVSEGTPSHITAASARAALMSYGCSNVSALTRGPNDTWQGRCQKGSNTIDVAVDQQGKVVSK